MHHWFPPFWDYFRPQVHLGSMRVVLGTIATAQAELIHMVRAVTSLTLCRMAESGCPPRAHNSVWVGSLSLWARQTVLSQCTLLHNTTWSLSACLKRSFHYRRERRIPTSWETFFNRWRLMAISSFPGFSQNAFTIRGPMWSTSYIKLHKAHYMFSLL